METRRFVPSIFLQQSRNPEASEVLKWSRTDWGLLRRHNSSYPAYSGTSDWHHLLQHTACFVGSCSDLDSFQARSISRYCFNNMCMVKVSVARLWRAQPSHSFKDENWCSMFLHATTHMVQILPWRSRTRQSHWVPSRGMETQLFLVETSVFKTKDIL